MPLYRRKAPDIQFAKIVTCSLALLLTSTFFLSKGLAQEVPEKAPERQRTKEFWPIYSYKDEDGEKTLKVVWPFYERRSSQKNAALYLRPFFSRVSSYDDRTQSWSVFWPLIESSRTPEKRHSHALPFYWNTQSANESRSILAPFYYAYRNDAEDRVQAFITPNIWYQSHGVSSSWHVFPILGYGKDGERKRFWSALYPLFKGERDEALGQSKYDIFWPLAGYRNDDFVGHYSWSPLHYASKNVDQSSSLITPFMAYKTDSQQRTTSAVFPLYLRSNHWLDQQSDDFYSPLYWSSKQDSGAKKRGVFPFYYRSQGARGEGSKTILAPFFYHQRDKFSKNLAVLPFYYGSSDARDQSKSLFLPPFYWSRKHAQGQDSMIGPLVFTGHNNVNQSRYLNIAPFYWSSRSEADQSSSTLFAPFYWNRETASRRDSVYGPFIYSGFDKNTQDSYFNVAPFIWTKKSGAGGSQTFIPPFYYKSENSQGSSAVYGPFIYKGENKSANSRYLHVAPFYWHTEKGTPENMTESSTFLAPFYYKQENENRKDWGLAPFLFKGENKKNGDSYLNLPPLYWSTKANNGDGTQVLAPFYWSRKVAGRHDSALAPFLFKGQDSNNDSRYLHVPPFYWSSQDRESRSTFIPSLYWNRTNSKGWDSVYGPFAFAGRNNESQSSYLHLPPLYWSTNQPNGHGTNALLPFYWKQKNESDSNAIYSPFIYKGENKRTDSRYLHVPPFYWHTESGASTASIHTSTTVLAPIYYNKETENRRDWAIMPFLFKGENKKNGDSYLHLPPLYWSSKSERKDESLTLIAPLYLDSQSYKHNYQSIMGLFWRSESPTHTNYTMFPNVFYKGAKDSEDKDLTLFPVFGYERYGESRSVSVLWPLMKCQTKGDDYKAWALPLFYGHKTGTKRFQMAFPLYWNIEDRDGRALHIWPLLAYERDNDGGRAYSTLWPMLSYESGPNRSAFYLRPFLTHLRTEESAIDAFYPLFYRRQSLEKEQVVDQRFWFLWPLFDRKKNSKKATASSFGYAFRHQWTEGKGTNSQLFWRLYSYEWDAVAEKTKLQLLYGLVYRERSQDVSKLKFRPLFSYETYKTHGGGDYVSFLSGLFSYERFGTHTPDDRDDFRKIRFLGIPYSTKKNTGA
jgi:hypothetical protein